jgi:bifunctional enzyme CysN/CysC
VPAAITDLKFRTNVNTLEHTAATKIDLNEVATVVIATNRPIAFDPYAANPSTGGFILVDRLSNATLAAGTIEFGLRRAQNLTYQSFDVNRQVRARMKGQIPHIVWFTGLSGSGKSSVANLLEKRLTAEGRHAYILDGDNIRHGLNKDLGFTEAARVENIRRVAEVARLMADAGLIVLVSFISPFEKERRLAREIAGDIDFTEVYVDTPLEVCEARDPKGLYKRARAGEIKNFTGIDSPFEVPLAPEVVLHGGVEAPDALSDFLHEKLSGKLSG